MKVKEVLFLMQTKPLNEIAKEHLSVGEKLAREALKNAGAQPQRGKRGWSFGGAKENLEKNLEEFVEVKVKRKVKANVSTNVTKNKTNKETKKQSSNKTMNETTKEQMRKRASFDIDKELLKRLKIASVIEEKNVYEIVEEALRAYLDKKNQ
ncbi:hypothetical protein [Priestia megaterium]|uniref:hypothetical protein n=1 Tax=Priestia megaterium TaxID=1404 RepID=UPI0028777C6A|nr:hypothetical protein [Priestia megaterium]MBX4164448.1 hypothetical protein [Priestia megaterium]